jgi:hypothetical protein
MFDARRLAYTSKLSSTSKLAACATEGYVIGKGGA